MPHRVEEALQQPAGLAPRLAPRLRFNPVQRRVQPARPRPRVGGAGIEKVAVAGEVGERRGEEGAGGRRRRPATGDRGGKPANAARAVGVVPAKRIWDTGERRERGGETESQESDRRVRGETGEREAKRG